MMLLILTTGIAATAASSRSPFPVLPSVQAQGSNLNGTAQPPTLNNTSTSTVTSTITNERVSGSAQAGKDHQWNASLVAPNLFLYVPLKSGENNITAVESNKSSEVATSQIGVNFVVPAPVITSPSSEYTSRLDLNQPLPVNVTGIVNPCSRDQFIFPQWNQTEFGQTVGMPLLGQGGGQGGDVTCDFHTGLGHWSTQVMLYRCTSNTIAARTVLSANTIVFNNLNLESALSKPITIKISSPPSC